MCIIVIVIKKRNFSGCKFSLEHVSSVAKVIAVVTSGWDGTLTPSRAGVPQPKVGKVLAAMCRHKDRGAEIISEPWDPTERHMLCPA